MKQKFAAQLYTLRDELEKDFPGVLRDLKRMGWPAVQISGLRGHTVEEIAATLKETGLKTAGMHISLAEINSDLAGVLEQAKAFNTKDLVVPFISEEYRNELGYRLIRSNLNDIARKINRFGYTLSYHNHAFEFGTEIDGKNAMEFMLDPGGDNAVLAEIDVYWVKKGGLDPVSFIAPYANRMPIIHLKDMTNDEEQAFAEVGTGSIDFAPILTWGEQNGVEWYAVEQDVCRRPPMDCLQTSLDNLHKLAEQVKKA
jgi:sugar phosphate isomerase/epimerase